MKQTTMLVAIISGILFLSVSANAYSYGDPCSLVPQGPRDSTSVIDVTVPATCRNGTFDWNYPQGTINVHFPNPNSLTMSICLTNYLGGEVFSIYDGTGGAFTLIELDDRFNGHSVDMRDKESCTPYHSTAITLRFRAPPTMYYMGEVEYRLKR